MIYAKLEDIDRCIIIVKHELNKRNIIVSENVLKEMTIDIMNISYSKGGDYSNEIVQSFARTYVEEGFYKKY
ncbi:hypothetical protein IMSAGC009_03328 [Lachnospiraceae bacterium]|nr:hypothetical protein IMSAGC009_03328 [Lachnospiraceae bacterium]